MRTHGVVISRVRERQERAWKRHIEERTLDFERTALEARRRVMEQMEQIKTAESKTLALMQIFKWRPFP